MNFTYQHKTYQLLRYPSTTNRSLKAWSAADEHLLQYLDDLQLPISTKVAIYHDRFGFLTCTLHRYNLTQVIAYKSQEKAVQKNRDLNGLGKQSLKALMPLEAWKEKQTVAILKIPKSLDLWDLYLQHICEGLEATGVVLAGFMTRHFSPQILELAGHYFEEVEQSRAWKKSRVLVLRKKKQDMPKRKIKHLIAWEGHADLQQYYGVFSAKRVDYATQFLLENLDIKEEEQSVLDVGTGNGVIGAFIRKKNPTATLYLLDDTYLAIESAKLNVTTINTHFIWDDSLEQFKQNTFDLIVTNPPFHFEHENNMEVSLRLFWEVLRCLKPTGRFVLVANQHLNYQTHLRRMFPRVQIKAEHEKFVVYVCQP